MRPNRPSHSNGLVAALFKFVMPWTGCCDREARESHRRSWRIRSMQASGTAVAACRTGAMVPTKHWSTVVSTSAVQCAIPLHHEPAVGRSRVSCSRTRRGRAKTARKQRKHPPNGRRPSRLASFCLVYRYDALSSAGRASGCPVMPYLVQLCQPELSALGFAGARDNERVTQSYCHIVVGSLQQKFEIACARSCATGLRE